MSNLNKKKIITNTLIFIFVMVFVLIFKAIFGDDNTLIGVTTITATLMLLQRDFTAEPLKNVLKFIGVNLLMGIGAYFAVDNILIAIPINFIVVFTFSYIFTYNLRQPLYFPFGLQYLFLLSTPVSMSRLGVRIVALLCGALIIMISQLIVNKNKLSSSGNKLLLDVCESIENKLKCIKWKSKSYNLVYNVHTSVDEFRTIIYDKRELDYYLTEEARAKLNMSVALENINEMLCYENIQLVDNKIIDYLENLIQITKETLKFKKPKEKMINSKDYNIDKLLNYAQEKDITDLLSLQLIESIIFLDETTVKLNKLEENNNKKVNKISEKSQVFSKESIRNILKGKNSPKFCYAMRMAISITIGGFIIDYFKLKEGRWILFTILSLTTPLYETSKDRIKYRLLSTLIGSIIIVILFSIFTNQTVRLLIVMLTGYLQSYVNEYKYRMIFITVCAIGTAAVVGSVRELTIERILMVIIGTIIAIISNKYLFPYSLKNSNEQLKKIYNETIKEMFEEINILLTGSTRLEIMNNLFIITSLVESKSRINKQIVNDENYGNIVNIRRNLVGNIYELYRSINSSNINDKDKGKIRLYINELMEYKHENIDSRIISIENSIKENKNIKARIVLSSIASVFRGLKELNKLKEQAQN